MRPFLVRIFRASSATTVSTVKSTFIDSGIDPARKNEAGLSAETTRVKRTLRVLVSAVTVDRLPVVEHGLGEGLSTGGGSEVGVETERLGDGQIRYSQLNPRTRQTSNSPFMVYMGVPGRCSAENTCPRRTLRHE